MAAKYPSIPQDSGEDTDKGSGSSVFSVHSSADNNTTVPPENITSGTTPDNDAMAAKRCNNTTHPDNDPPESNNDPGETNDSDDFKDLKLADKIKITDEEWEKLCEMTAVQSCLQNFDKKQALVKAAIQRIKKEQGELPADITGVAIAEIIDEMEEDDGSAATDPGTSAIIDISDQGHQDDGTHEVHVAIKCETCEKQGVKPVVTFK